MLGCMAAITVLLLIPPMAAAVAIPNLAAQFPSTWRPHEAAYVAICFKALPAGLLGLLVAGIFAAAMASMDNGLNLNAGLFVRSFYRTVLRPVAGERELLLVAKACTLVFGLLIMAIAYAFSIWSSLDLFNLLQATSSVLSFPLVMPMVLGLFVRRAPPWAGWSTMVVGMATAWAGRLFGLGRVLGAFLGAHTLSARELPCMNFAGNILAVLLTEGVWFGLVTFLRREPEAEHVAGLFEDFKRPVVAAIENPGGDDARQYRVMGRLCLIYGLGIASTALFVHGYEARAALAFCGGTIAMIGAVLALRGRRANA
jgi:Na+/proline symporter